MRGRGRARQRGGEKEKEYSPGCSRDPYTGGWYFIATINFSKSKTGHFPSSHLSKSTPVTRMLPRCKVWALWASVEFKTQNWMTQWQKVHFKYNYAISTVWLSSFSKLGRPTYLESTLYVWLIHIFHVTSLEKLPLNLSGPLPPLFSFIIQFSQCHLSQVTIICNR